MSITQSAKAPNTKAVQVKSKTPSNPKQGVARVNKPAVKSSQNAVPIAQASKATKPALATAQTAAELKPASKHKTIIDLLMHQGASIMTLMQVTGWQAHSVRGFISGTIKNKLGLPVTSKKQDGVLIYSIAKQK